MSDTEIVQKTRQCSLRYYTHISNKGICLTVLFYFSFLLHFIEHRSKHHFAGLAIYTHARRRYTHARARTDTHTRLHAHTRTFVWIRTHARMNTCISMHTDTQGSARTHVHTRTHQTCILNKSPHTHIQNKKNLETVLPISVNPVKCELSINADVN